MTARQAAAWEALARWELDFSKGERYKSVSPNCNPEDPTPTLIAEAGVEPSGIDDGARAMSASGETYGDAAEQLAEALGLIPPLAPPPVDHVEPGMCLCDACLPPPRPRAAELAALRRVHVAAKSLTVYILTVGKLENHGHRDRPGMCGSCAALNGMLAALEAFKEAEG